MLSGCGRSILALFAPGGYQGKGWLLAKPGILLGRVKGREAWVETMSPLSLINTFDLGAQGVELVTRLAQGTNR